MDVSGSWIGRLFNEARRLPYYPLRSLCECWLAEQVKREPSPNPTYLSLLSLSRGRGIDWKSIVNRIFSPRDWKAAWFCPWLFQFLAVFWLKIDWKSIKNGQKSSIGRLAWEPLFNSDPYFGGFSQKVTKNHSTSNQRLPFLTSPPNPDPEVTGKPIWRESPLSIDFQSKSRFSVNSIAIQSSTSLQIINQSVFGELGFGRVGFWGRVNCNRGLSIGFRVNCNCELSIESVRIVSWGWQLSW